MATDGTTRTAKFPSGIASVGIGEVERQVPLDEPPPLPPNAALALIGKPVPRYNGRAKVTGATRFTVDVTLAGMLYGRILRAPLPHAQIRSIDVSAATGYPGVRAVLLIAHPDDPVASVVRYIGAPVAAVAAVSMAAAEEALRLIRVDYKPLPFVADIDKARETAAPRVHDAASAPEGFASGFLKALPRVFRRHAGCRSTGMCADRQPTSGGTRGKASHKPTSLSRASTAPGCRPTAAWSRMRSLPIGGRTA